VLPDSVPPLLNAVIFLAGADDIVLNPIFRLFSELLKAYPASLSLTVHLLKRV